MIKNYIVQKGSYDEWKIQGQLEGNIYSDKLVFMVHSGGYNKDENGYFLDIENGKIKTININGKLKRKLIKQPLGNFERLSSILQKESNCAIFRMDLRNHGGSLVNGKMDERDTSLERLARDISSVIDELIKEYGYEHIHLVGACLGSLAGEHYVTGTGINEYEKMINRDKVKSMSLISPLSNAILSTENPNYGFNYNKVVSILNNEIKQFTKMRGVFEGKSTIMEARKNIELPLKLARLNIPTLYIASTSDRLIPIDAFTADIESMKKENKEFKEIIFAEGTIGTFDHCFYDPHSSEACLTHIINFLNQLLIENKYR